MKNIDLNIKEQKISNFLDKSTPKNSSNRSDINVLLNRIELNKKNEYRKKLYFSAAASTGLILFGLMIF
jgi:hypothetical protein